MAQVTGILGNVAWSGGDPQSALVASLSPQSYTFDWASDTFDEPVFNDANPNTLRGLGSWGGTINFLYQTKPTGSTGLVTWANGYSAFVESWNLNINVAEHAVTAFNATAPTNKTYILGRLTANFTLDAYLDGSSQDIVTLPNTNDPSAVTLRYDDNTADGQVDFDAVISQQNIQVDPNNPNRIRISADVDGALSATGTASFLPSGAYAVGDFRQLVLTETTSRTITGSAAVTSISTTCPVSEPIRVVVGYRGTGTPATA